MALTVAHTGAAAAPLPAGLRAVIADDERLMREQLSACLQVVWPALAIVGQARNGLEAVELVAQQRPDIVFLDIRMPGLTGIEAAAQILQLDFGEAPVPAIVFLTAYDQYALQAFEQGAIDYVLKPAEPGRLLRTAQRLAQRMAHRLQPGSGANPADQANQADPANPTSPATEPTQHLQRLLHQLAAQLSGQPPAYLRWLQVGVGVGANAAVQLVPIEDVLFLISDDKYTRVQTAQFEGLIRRPIKELVECLDPDEFWQIHRSTLVRIRAIAGVSRDARGRQLVALRGHGEKLEVSRSFAGLFRAM